MMAHWQKIGRARWLALSSRERLGLSWAGALFLGVIAWQGLIAPAANTLNKTQTQHLAMAQSLSQMQALKAQAEVLQQRSSLSNESALKALQGLSPSGSGSAIQINPQGDRVLVNFKAVPADVLAQWLQQARAQAQALPSEVHLTRATNATNATPQWDGNLVLVLPRGSRTGAP